MALALFVIAVVLAMALAIALVVMTTFVLTSRWGHGSHLPPSLARCERMMWTLPLTAAPFHYILVLLLNCVLWGLLLAAVPLDSILRPARWRRPSVMA